MISRLIAAALLGLTCTAHVGAQSEGTSKLSLGSVEIVKVKDGEYRYRIKNPEGVVIAASPDAMVWEKDSDVQKTLQEITTILKACEPTEDPETKAKFKDKESAYSYRIRNANGVIIAAPPADLQWQTRAEVLSVFLRLRVILQTTTPIEVPLQQPLNGREVNGVVGGLPTGIHMNPIKH